MNDPTPETFLRDVQHHKMTVLLDQGLYRHLRFKQPGSGNMWFEIITWPNVLTIHGDMGTWTFSRVEDMFTFFRGSDLKINPSYWAEKLQHGNFSGRDGGKVWNQDTFRAHLLDQLARYFEDEPAKLAEITPVVEEDIFRLHDGDGPHVMHHAAYEFTYVFEEDREPVLAGFDRAFKSRYSQKNQFQFEGMDLPDGMIYSYHFLWCLYAIVWGIQQWDARAAVAA